MAIASIWLLNKFHKILNTLPLNIRKIIGNILSTVIVDPDKKTKLIHLINGKINSSHVYFLIRTLFCDEGLTTLFSDQSLKEAEMSKVIENVQRDINIAFMNEIFLISNKLKIDFFKVIRLASTKWNFLNFNPGLVGGHCLPVDPYYLYFIAKQKKLEASFLLSGRNINNKMETDKNSDSNIPRNSLCPCGSGKKYKRCCGKL